MKAVHVIAFILVIIGALNWGLIGISPSWDVVGMIFGSVSWLLRLVYILVGISALVLIFTHGKNCMMCKKSGSASTSM